MARILMRDETDYGNLFDTVVHVGTYKGKPFAYSDVVAYVHGDTDVPHYQVPALCPDYPYDVEWYLTVTCWTDEQLDAYLRYQAML